MIIEYSPRIAIIIAIDIEIARVSESTEGRGIALQREKRAYKASTGCYTSQRFTPHDDCISAAAASAGGEQRGRKSGWESGRLIVGRVRTVVVSHRSSRSRRRAKENKGKK